MVPEDVLFVMMQEQNKYIDEVFHELSQHLNICINIQSRLKTFKCVRTLCFFKRVNIFQTYSNIFRTKLSGIVIEFRTNDESHIFYTSILMIDMF